MQSFKVNIPFYQSESRSIVNFINVTLKQYSHLCASHNRYIEFTKIDTKQIVRKRKQNEVKLNTKKFKVELKISI